MSTSATLKRTTRDATQPMPSPWKLTITNAPPGSPLSRLNGRSCIVDIIGPPSAQGVVLIGGNVDNESQTPFVGYFSAGQEISYTLTFEGALYTFFGVFNPSVNGRMIGLIKSNLPDGGDADAEDEATWSAQARPVTEDSRRPGAAAENSRR
ncbi:MAG: hypothetical protein ABW208_03240 [Pyrinomonadaceae bacterium]